MRLSPRLPGLGSATDVLTFWDRGPGWKGGETQGSLKNLHTTLEREAAAVPTLATRGHYQLRNGYLREKNRRGEVSSGMGRGSGPRAIWSLGKGREGLVEGPAWENPWSIKRWSLLGTEGPWAGPGSGKLTCVGWSVVAANISGLVRVGGHHFIVVLVWAVDTHLGSPAGLAAWKLPGPDLVPYPLHPAHSPLGPRRCFPEFIMSPQAPATS